MTTLAPTRPRWPGGRRLADGHTLYWWIELVAIAGYYGIYSAIRNANQGGQGEAFTNARRLISLQRGMGLNVEERVQEWALHFQPAVVAANYFYGSLHFVVTIGAALFLFARHPDDYPLWRNTLAIATALALIGFVLFPLMPPRLLPGTYGFVDTLARYPTFWSFNSGAVSRISNQYAAMPSVHVAWATWCACIFFPRVRSRAAKALAVAYPVLTVLVIVVTGNHYLLDAGGGLVILTAGYLVARRITRAGQGPPLPAA